MQLGRVLFMELTPIHIIEMFHEQHIHIRQEKETPQQFGKRV
jgi:hypothetical protein